MKKITIIAIAALLTMSLAACTEKNVPEPAASESVSEEKPAASVSEEKPAASASEDTTTESADTKTSADEPDDTTDNTPAREPSIHDIVGKWTHEVWQESEVASPEFNGVPVGEYEIYEDGSYTYTTDGVNYSSGIIELAYDEYPDGSRVPVYVFYDENGDVAAAGTALLPEEREDGCIYFGNGGMERIVPADMAR